MIITGGFNESVCSSNMQNFMNETGLFYVFQEINGAETEQRDDAFDHGKFIDFVLATEGDVTQE